MLNLSRDEIVTLLRRAKLYNRNYGYSTLSPDSVNGNHLLYWKNLRLFDFKENPIQHGSYNNSGTELSRTITLKINMGKLTKKYGDCLVTIPPAHSKLLLGKPPEISLYNVKEKLLW